MIGTRRKQASSAKDRRVDDIVNWTVLA